MDTNTKEVEEPKQKKRKPYMWEKQKLYFLHIRLIDEKKNVFPTGGITFCYLAEEQNGEMYVKWTIAVASLLQTYCKQLGRNISAGRLTAKHFKALEETLEFPNGFACPAGGELHLEKGTKFEDIPDKLREIGVYLIQQIFLDDADDEDDEDLDDEDDTSVH